MTKADTDKATEQLDRIIETACALGADKNEAAFKERLAVVALPEVKRAPQPIEKEEP